VLVRHDVNVRHELWVDADGLDMFCLAGPKGAEARASLAAPSRLVWTVEASSHFEAMSAYYRYRDLGTYTTEYPEWDHKSYRDHGWE
jgi:hypothetical protein